MAMSFFFFFDYHLVAIMLYREYPEKSFKSFSLLANALPIGIPAEGLGLGILQQEIGILQLDWYSSDSWGIGFPEGYFPAETFHNAYPSAGMPTGRVFAEGLKLMKDFSGYSLQGIINDRIPLKKVIYVHRQSMCTSSAK